MEQVVKWVKCLTNVSLDRKVVGHLEQSDCDEAVREGGRVWHVVDKNLEGQRVGEGISRRLRQSNLKSLWAKVRKLFNSYRDSHLEKGYFYKLM